ncbi:MAG: hypothetical protein Kow00129_13540 [Thermoleophilia bacterium]
MARDGRNTHLNYCSGEDYILEFRSFRYGFNSVDFRQRVELAAVELDLVEPGCLDDDERADLVQLVASGRVDFPVSNMGEYIRERGDEILNHRGECLIYWLRELVFRGAWLDQRLMDDQLEVVFNAEEGRFFYYPRGHRSRQIGPPPHPSWRDVAYLK